MCWVCCHLNVQKERGSHTLLIAGAGCAAPPALLLFLGSWSRGSSVECVHCSAPAMQHQTEQLLRLKSDAKKFYLRYCPAKQGSCLRILLALSKKVWRSSGILIRMCWRGVGSICLPPFDFSPLLAFMHRKGVLFLLHLLLIKAARTPL